MKRRDVPEIEDQRWCPEWLRSAMTGYLQEAIRLSRPYASAAPRIAELLIEQKSANVVDLCSGAGGPWPELRETIEAEGVNDVSIVLTDLHPNGDAIDALRTQSRLRYFRDPVSALAVPTQLTGVRTMFTALHHFGRTEIRAILDSARQDQTAFAAFEATHRSVKGLLITLLIPFLVLLLMPRVRPFRWQSILFTYLLPIIPLAIWWDGFASTLRTYRASDLEELGVGDIAYEVSVTERVVKGLPVPMLEVIGRPIRRA